MGANRRHKDTATTFNMMKRRTHQRWTPHRHLRVICNFASYRCLVGFLSFRLYFRYSQASHNNHHDDRNWDTGNYQTDCEPRASLKNTIQPQIR